MLSGCTAFCFASPYKHGMGGRFLGVLPRYDTAGWNMCLVLLTALVWIEARTWGIHPFRSPFPASAIIGMLMLEGSISRISIAAPRRPKISVLWGCKDLYWICANLTFLRACSRIDVSKKILRKNDHFFVS